MSGLLADDPPLTESERRLLVRYNQREIDVEQIGLDLEELARRLGNELVSPRTEHPWFMSSQALSDLKRVIRAYWKFRETPLPWESEQ
jgi:hypothetical protein